MLQQCDEDLVRAYDTAVLDLDGVVYIGPQAVPGAAAALERAARGGMHLAYITNNAARTPAAVGAHLRDLGIPARDDDVVTSAQAAARLCSELVGPGAPVYVIGGEGLEEALRERGLEPVTSGEAEPAAVVQGYGPEMPWRQVVQGAILVADGLPWVASNMDLTIPTASGVGPGNGTLVELVARHAGRDPVVAGKPAKPLFEETQRRVGTQRPLVVGDRLDTDIAGAVAMGWDSLLVMTGVTGPQELVAARPEERPSFVAADLSALLRPAPAPRATDGTWTCGGWSATVHADGRLEVEGRGGVDDWWRVVAAAGWSHLDEHGQPCDMAGLVAPEGTANSPEGTANR